MENIILTSINSFLAGFIVGTIVTRYRTTKNIISVLKKAHAAGKTLKNFLEFVDGDEEKESGVTK